MSQIMLRELSKILRGLVELQSRSCNVLKIILYYYCILYTKYVGKFMEKKPKEV